MQSDQEAEDLLREEQEKQIEVEVEVVVAEQPTWKRMFDHNGEEEEQMQKMRGRRRKRRRGYRCIFLSPISTGER